MDAHLQTKAANPQTNSSTVKKPLYEGSTQYKSWSWRYSPELATRTSSHFPRCRCSCGHSEHF
ncbi:hypothetical protein P692DRAFT_201798418 [Suillus brevipes Sb2]|nr:hypothetical protein P692DRAFT_201798418 [Suillus brevipes Sb2]